MTRPVIQMTCAVCEPDVSRATVPATSTASVMTAQVIRAFMKVVMVINGVIATDRSYARDVWVCERQSFIGSKCMDRARPTTDTATLLDGTTQRCRAESAEAKGESGHGTSMCWTAHVVGKNIAASHATL